MNMVELKIEDEGIRKSLEGFARYEYFPEKKIRGLLQHKCFAISVDRIFEAREKQYRSLGASPRKAELFINQDGLQNREFSTDEKKEFKQIFKTIREEHPTKIPQPFTGRIDLHCGNRRLKTISIHPNN